MKDDGMKDDRRESHPHGDRQPRRIRLPGFIEGEQAGLGDAIKRATSYLGIKPCGGCSRRAEALNRRVVFTNRRSG